MVGGAATIQGQGGPAVIVNQSTSSAVINWNTFNIRANESVRFNQPSASSVALNRVTGGLGPSEIMGTLTANGRVFIINRDGILFGPGSVVNTAGFLATTNDIKNADFMAGRYNFNIPGRPDASIVNQGRITATSGGFAALVAPGVRNSGTITATLGTVALASGNSFTLDMYGDKLITLAVGDSIANKVIDVATGRPLKSLVSNTKSGVISANGGRVELTAAAARAVVDSVINTKGVIRANSIGRHNGMIVLNAATGGSKPAGAPAQTIKLAGTISAAGRHRGTTGGTIVVSGEHIKVANAKIDASGRRGGGKILIGGDWGGGHPDLSLVTNASAKLENFTIATATTVSVDANSTINASATGRGHGGKVVLWSDNQTTFAGTILAKGGAKSGDGGFVEVSSKGQLAFAGNVDTRAPQGKTGTLLLDPTNLTIVSSCYYSCPESEMTAASLAAALNQNSTVISADNDLLVNAGVSWNTSYTLTMNAGHNIEINAPISAPSGGLKLNAGNLITAPNAVNVATFTLQNGTWSQVSETLPTFSAGDFRIAGGTFIRALAGNGASETPYQITDVYGLQGIGSAGMTSKYFVIADTIDAIGTANWNDGAGFRPIGATGSGEFTGSLDGEGRSISNLRIAPIDSTTRNIGLFGIIGSTGKVTNLNLLDVKVIANPGVAFQKIGTLAGTNHGTITHVFITGDVDGGSAAGALLGGLVGVNGGFGRPGSITFADANVNVTSAGSNVVLGGLAAFNSRYSTILASIATGNVTATATAEDGGHIVMGGFVGINRGWIEGATSYGNVGSATLANAEVGGLVGRNSGRIVSSAAHGDVQAGDNSTAGGLVGSNLGHARIIDSYALGNVAGGNSAYAGGLVGKNAGTISGYNGAEFRPVERVWPARAAP